MTPKEILLELLDDLRRAIPPIKVRPRSLRDGSSPTLEDIYYSAGQQNVLEFIDRKINQKPKG